MTRARAIIPLAFVALLAVASIATASNALLLRGKELYRNADYEEALATLDQVTNDTASPDYMEAAEYRLFCLIALGRTDDARHAVETLVEKDPFYRISDQASPRVRTLFTDVRRTMLPGVVEREYADAKAAFDRKDPTAAARFRRVNELLGDPDLPSKSALADLQIVTSGFLELSKAFTPPPAAPPAAPAARPIAAPATEPAAPRPQAEYREGDPGVVPPVPLNETIPPFALSREVKAPPEGLLELLIDENGAVVSAKMRDPINPRYDQQLTKIAMSWKYVPAKKDGVPVRLRKIVRVRIVPN